MREEHNPRQHLPRREVFWATLALVGVVVSSACSRSAESLAEAAEPVASPAAVTRPTTTTIGATTVRSATTLPTTSTSTTVLPSTSRPPTTTTTTTGRPTTTTLPPTTTTTTTTVAPVTSAPIQVPDDLHASEPVIELGSIEIPKIGVHMTMYEGIRLTTLDHGPGHWPGSAMPGQPGNIVVAGHRTSKHRVFRNVDQLVAGDHILFHDSNGTHTYAVREIEVVEPTAVWIVDPTPTPTATLFACHPPGSTRQRIVVFADLVS